MKKFTLFLSALLFTMMSFAQLANGYEKVTDITTLSAGDKVVLYCDEASLGVTGWGGSKDATVAETGWVEYIVEVVADSVLLKDPNAGKYIAMTTKNAFKYDAKGSACKVNNKGVLYCTKYAADNGDYFLYQNNQNGTLYYRMYKDKSAETEQYKPFYVYKVTGEVDPNFVDAPRIEGTENFREETVVTIEATEGLTVYYTLDGTDPTKTSTKYTTPFELKATTTVKAIAYKGDKASTVTSKTFTKMTILTCEEALELCTGDATEEKHIVHGYVTEMIEAYNPKFGNITFWMADTKDGGQVLQAYRVKPVSEEEQSLAVGDYVEVIGKLMLYTKDDVSTPEVAAGSSVEKLPAPTTAIDNVTVNQNITKFFENGQLVIIKNGVRYNAQGQVIE